MRTPQELLLARHRAIEPKLDAIRKQVLAAALDSRRSTFDSWLATGWRELFWSCRRAWLGLAAVWVVILALNFASADAPGVKTAAASAGAPDLIQAWKQRQQLVAELTEQKAEPAEPPKRPVPRPHSERRAECMIG